MSDIGSSIEEAKLALSRNDAKQALKVLKPFRKSLKTTNATNLPLLEIFSECYLENGQVEKAYPLLVQTCELDPTGSQGGCDKFFSLGQIVGGQDGISAMAKGIENISTIAGDNLSQELIDKIVSGLLSMIEIWMTDLCMEDDAETQCENLISKAMEISENSSPEAWATLGSIRISQQRFADAAEAFSQSWDNYEIRKNKLSESIMNGTNIEAQGDYVDMLQPLLSLARMCMEVGSYETALKVESVIKEIDEDNLEGYYLEGFTNYLICKLEMFKLANPDFEVTPENIYTYVQNIQETPLDMNNSIITEYIQDSRIALSFAAALGVHINPSDTISQELYSGTLALLQELGGPIDDSALQKLRKGDLADGDDEELDVNDLVDDSDN